MACYDKSDIRVVRGDILELYFIMETMTASEIKTVYFTCAEQGLQIECPYSEKQEGYCLRIISADSRTLKPIVSRYDLTVRFADDNDFTPILSGVFTVLDKKNTINGG